MDMCSVQLLSPSSSSPIQTDSECSLHRDQNLPKKPSLRLLEPWFDFHLWICRLNLSTSLLFPFITTPAIIKPRIVRVRIVSLPRLCRIPVFVNLSQISAEVLPLHKPQLLEPWDFTLDLPSPLPSLDFPMPAQLSCHCLCVRFARERCSRLSTELHRTWITHLVSSMTLLLFRMQETWLASTSIGSDYQTKLRLHVRHDFQARILEYPQAIRVECHVFLQFFGRQCLQTSKLDLIVECILHLFLIARHWDSHRSIPDWSFNREHLPREMIVRSKFRFLLPVVGSNRFCSLRHASDVLFRELAKLSFASQLVRASECCVDLQKHELQIAHTFAPRSSKSAGVRDR